VLRVALTGGIATGKSYVRRRVAARGVPTIDADAVVHELLSAGSPVVAAVAARFGRDVLASDGGVDRRALARLAFSDPSARQDLEAILHPRVDERIAGWFARQAESGARWALADIPLLFEAGRQGDFDLVVATLCPPEEQVRRVMARDGATEAEARARLAAQWPASRKAALAQVVIDTSGSFALTDRQTDAFCRRMDQGVATGRAFGL
jgi:dephospho-CoA kinase